MVATTAHVLMEISTLMHTHVLVSNSYIAKWYSRRETLGGQYNHVYKEKNFKKNSHSVFIHSADNNKETFIFSFYKLIIWYFYISIYDIATMFDIWDY